MTNEKKYLYFEVLSGRALELVRDHIAAETANDDRNRALAAEMGAYQFWKDPCRGTLTAVAFEGKVPTDFTKPARGGRTVPKKDSPWRERLENQQGYDCRCIALGQELGIVTSIGYSGNGTAQGSSVIGHGFQRIHVLYLGAEGPCAIVFADPRSSIKSYKDRGYAVDEACENFKAELPGCRLILEEEWKLAVAQHELSEARALNSEGA